MYQRRALWWLYGMEQVVQLLELLMLMAWILNLRRTRSILDDVHAPAAQCVVEVAQTGGGRELW